MGKQVDIMEQYAIEMRNISQKLAQLEKGHVSELTHVEAHGSLQKNAKELKGLLADLFMKIEHGKRSAAQDMGSVIASYLKKK